LINFGLGVSLDAISEGDLEQLRTWRNDRHINQYCRQVGLISESDQAYWHSVKDPTIRMFAVKQSVGTLIGCCGLTSIDHINRRAEFSLYIGTEHQGLGYGKKALKTLLKFGFHDLGLNTIWGECFDGNIALDMFTGLGMKLEGTRRQFYFKDGAFIDAHLVSITQSEYLEAKWNIL